MRKLIFLFFVFVNLLNSCSQKSGENSEQEFFNDSTEINKIIIDSIEDSDPGIKIGVLEKSLIDAGLVNVSQEIPRIKVELKYSTTDNFFGKDVYGELENCYLQPEVVELLKLALKALQEKHPDLSFIIFDGVRPLSVQKYLWDHLEKPDSIKPLYVADPKKGSLHNYGVAVDLTLYDLNTGEILDMGTRYDYFGYPAYPDKENEMLKAGKINKTHIKNREILRSAMLSAGFSGIGSEWWHFNAYCIKEAQEKFEIIR